MSVNLTDFALRNSRLTVVMALTILLAGLMLFMNYPAQEDPDIKVREALVFASYPGMSPERVEELLVRPLEERLRQIPQIQRIEATAKTGLAMVSVKVWDRYFDLAPIWQDVRNKMNDARGALPSGTIGPIVNDDFGLVAAATIAVTADGFTMGEMRDVVHGLRDRLNAMPGVRRIDIHGVQDERVFLNVDVNRLAGLGMTPRALISALQGQNVILPGGQIHADGMLIVVEPTGNFRSVSEIAELPIAVPDTGNVVYLRDAVTVARGYEDPPSTAVLYRNQEALVLAVSMTAGENIIDFGKRLRQRMAALEETLPVGFQVSFATFQPDVVQKSISDVERTLYETLVIVLVVVMVFLGFRTGLLVGTIVPLTMLMTLMVMSVWGIELQRVSIASMIISLGLLVDNGIVIAEDVMRRLAAGEQRRKACVEAGRTLALPLLTSSLTIILAFMPLMLAQDQTGEYTRSLSQVITISLLSSWLLSLTVTPLLCFWFVKVSTAHKGEGDEHYDTGFYRAYKRLLARVLRRRWAFLGLMVVALVGAVQLFGMVPKQFFPTSDRNQFMVIVNLPAGSAFPEMEAQARDVGAWLLDGKANPEITDLVTYLGYGGPRFVLAVAPVASAPHRAFLLVTLKSGEEVDAVVERTRAHLIEAFPDISAEVKKFWMGGTETGLVEFRVSGENANTLKHLAEQVKAMLHEIPGTIEIKDDWENRTIKMMVVVDQARARRAGVTSSDIANSLNTLFSGAAVSAFREGDVSIPIVLRGEESERVSLDRLRTVSVFSSSQNVSVPLLQIADFLGVPQDGVIKRRDMVRTIKVSGKNLDLKASQVVGRIKPQLAALEIPAGYQIRTGGEVEASGNAQGALMQFLPICMAAIVMLMVWQFNSVRKTLLILLTIPLCLIGATLGLLVSGASFGFMAIMGLFSLAGIIVNNAILLLERIHEEEADGKDGYQAVIQAAAKRLRPILMTKLTCILGLVPLMIFGGELWFAMAVVIAGGLALGTLLTLGVVPALYTLLFRVPIPQEDEPARPVPVTVA